GLSGEEGWDWQRAAAGAAVAAVFGLGTGILKLGVGKVFGKGMVGTAEKSLSQLGLRSALNVVASRTTEMGTRALVGGALVGAALDAADNSGLYDPNRKFLWSNFWEGAREGAETGLEIGGYVAGAGALFHAGVNVGLRAGLAVLPALQRFATTQ